MGDVGHTQKHANVRSTELIIQQCWQQGRERGIVRKKGGSVEPRGEDEEKRRRGRSVRGETVRMEEDGCWREVGCVFWRREEEEERCDNEKPNVPQEHLPPLPPPPPLRSPPPPSRDQPGLNQQENVLVVL